MLFYLPSAVSPALLVYLHPHPELIRYTMSDRVQTIIEERDLDVQAYEPGLESHELSQLHQHNGSSKELLVRAYPGRLDCQVLHSPLYFSLGKDQMIRPD
jgi:hypothetical protein